MKRFILFTSVVAALFFIFYGCNPRQKVPREFPDRDEMANILAELYLAENIMNHGGQGMYNMAGDDKIPGYYKGVLEKYQLTTTEFDTIRKWYAAHPYHFQAVYDKTIVILSQHEAALKKQIAAEEKQKTLGIKDLWVGPREISTQLTDTTDTRLPFSLAIDSLEEGNIRLTAFYKLLKEDMTRQARMLLVTHYADSTADTVFYDLPLSFQKKPASLAHSLDTSKIGVTLSGFLFDHDTTAISSVEVSDIRLQHFPDNQPPIEPEKDGAH